MRWDRWENNDDVLSRIFLITWSWKKSINRKRKRDQLPSWVSRSWRMRWDRWENPLWQMRHLKGLSPVWLRKWVVKSSLAKKALSQYWHWCSRLLKWSRSKCTLSSMTSLLEYSDAQIREINWSCLCLQRLCLQQFRKFGIWSACNDRKRKLC